MRSQSKDPAEGRRGRNKGKARRARKAAQKPQARRFSDEDRKRALEMVAARMAKTAVAKAIGTSTESLRQWVLAAEADGTMPNAPTGRGKPAVPASAARAGAAVPAILDRDTKRSPYAPRDPGHGLSEPETAAILELKRRHPSMGPAQIKAQLKRFKGWRVNLKSIARVLRAHGYEAVHRGPPKGPEPIRWEAPRRNALWQLDFAEVRVGEDRLYVLIVLDDFSRYVVAHALLDSPNSDSATETMKSGIARHGKPEAVRTDRGGAFVAYSKETHFGRYLEAEEIDHIVGRSYSPRGGGKVEAAVGTLRRELWEIEHFASREEAAQKLAAFFEDYNERRAHMGIDGLTPADRYFGRADRVLAVVNGLSRKRQGLANNVLPPGSPTEELSSAAGAPLEVLRLVIVGGEMELRFCGARVRLGRIEV
jgi:transposase InsO family protein/transposase-like protein